MSRPDVKWIPASSKNQTDYRESTIDSIVCHNTDCSLQAAIATFQDPEEQVSAHYIVARDGTCIQMVLEDHTAWHAGDRAMNHRSIGIEHVADKNNLGMTQEQQQCSLNLIGYLVDKYKIQKSHIHTHRTVDTIAGGTDCPKWIWPDEASFEKFKETIA
ncbi:MAG: peptidoglycan recognition family protein [Nostoc sp.]|uniref:N-acetylmuramoyl-L-alanine amidase n=1 Tax=Nostoc sp. TaxID=1180 RepID=UPI002FF4E1E7